jgi:hypothetical protein
LAKIRSKPPHKRRPETCLFLHSQILSFFSLSLSFHFFLNHETLPNFIKRKHPRNGEKKKQGARTKVQPSKEPKRGGPTRRQGNSLSISKPKERGSKPNKTPSLEEPSLAGTQERGGKPHKTPSLEEPSHM